VKALLSLAPLLLAAAPEPFPAPRTPGGVVRMSCRQGECMWQQLQKIERVRGDRASVLRKVSSRTGRSTYSVDGSPPAYGPRVRIAWERPGTDYVLCSKRRPATAFWDADEKQWIVTRLNLTDLGGYQYAAANLYMLVCHNIAPARWSERGMRHMGYGATPSDQTRHAKLAEMLRALG
jgi:hypothetical protein